ncbi:tetratricopeptide repeat-containing sensor histidine kinase [Hymenobacter qilianensis]|uniref:tetratricopeptide repeat-containing sensor histidine kinase n=1 Tax=Hymenobacter qilianensis TaxID=1385715 RepID=UPI001666FB3D|nr:ATP-binding protein [Hymenobacter qilianensis]
MKTLLLLCLLSFLSFEARTQDSVGRRWQAAVEAHPQRDTGRVNRLNTLAFVQRANAPQQTKTAYEEALNLSREIGYTFGEARALLGLGFYYRFRNQYELSLDYTHKARKLFVRLNDHLHEISCLYNLSYTASGQGNYAQAMAYSFQGLKLADAIPSQKWLTLLNSQLGNTSIALGEYQKARQYFVRGLKLARGVGDQDGIAHCVSGLGELCRIQGQWAQARSYFEQGAVLAKELNNQGGITMSLYSIADMDERLGNYRAAFSAAFRALQRMKQLDDVGRMPLVQLILARAYLDTEQPDSAWVYGREALLAGQRTGNKSTIRDASDVLAQASSARGRFDEAYRYLAMFIAYRDSLDNQEVTRRTAALQYQYALEKKQSQIQLLTHNQQLIRQQNSQQRLLLLGSLAALVIVAGLSVLLWLNNQQKQRSNAQLQRQQEELKATQAQLVQAEKLAALGELTAGIAHEIQNPLNFVTNFADVSADISQELQTEARAGNFQEVEELAAELEQNLSKITQHGQRASAIIKGMLEHARPSTSERKPTDLNALATEYLNLAYESLRAKAPAFEVELITDFEAGLEPVALVPPDIGRVLLNLYTNAFYAVQQKAAVTDPDYQPQVQVSTRQSNGQVELRVRDNGMGMPADVAKKVFQPFFTTKPPGEGTGLGLSLSYDIVTKGHGGTLTFESREGEGTDILITLPLNQAKTRAVAKKGAGIV